MSIMLKTICFFFIWNTLFTFSDAAQSTVHFTHYMVIYLFIQIEGLQIVSLEPVGDGFGTKQ